MIRSFWRAIAAYLVPTFVLGYLWHLSLFADRYELLAVYRDEVIIPFGLTTMAIQAVIFAWAYPRLFSREHGHWLRSAAWFGIVFGLLSWSFTTLPVAAKYRMTSVSDFILLESFFTVVQFAVVSPLIALSYRQRPDESIQTRSAIEQSHAV